MRFDLRWQLLTAREGDLIPADVFSAKSLDSEPEMVITFRIQKLYKGQNSAEIQVRTGLGGGDCAARFSPGLDYLVYAYGSSLDRLGVGMCSPGGWLGDARVSTDLRYLRNARPTSSDLAPIKLLLATTETPKAAEQRQRNHDEIRRRYDGATGRICGKVVSPNKDIAGSLSFLSTNGYSPVDYPDSAIAEDGSFCSPDLGPGKYYVFFVGGAEHGALAAYFPGVTDVASATAIEIGAGQQRSDLIFKIPERNSYSVRGIITAEEKSIFDRGELAIGLIRVDGDRRVWYRQSTMARILSKTAYFKFDDVVPGRYVAYIQAAEGGWLTKKVEVDVKNHSKFISLQLIRKK